MLHNKKKLASIVLLVMLALSFSKTPVYAYTGYKLLSVPSHVQQHPYWCWATCDQMIIQFFGGSATQSQIVSFIFGTPPPIDQTSAATVSQTSNALFNWNVNNVATSSSLAFGTVTSQINNNEPMIGGVSTGGTGHMYVIRGYYEDTGSNKQDLYLIDPGDGSYCISHYSVFSAVWTASIYNTYV